MSPTASAAATRASGNWRSCSDSRIGAFGASRWLCRCSLRWSALARLADPELRLPRPDCRARVLARLAPAPSCTCSPRPGPTAFGRHRQSPGQVAIAGRGARRCRAAPARASPRPSPRSSCLILLFIAFRGFAASQIGGQTGDMLGALQQPPRSPSCSSSRPGSPLALPRRLAPMPFQSSDELCAPLASTCLPADDDAAPPPGAARTR